MACYGKIPSRLLKQLMKYQGGPVVADFGPHSIPDACSSQNLPQTTRRRIDTELCEWVLMGVDPCEAGMSKVLRNMALELCQKLSVHPDPDNPYFFPSASTIRHIRDRENAKRRMHTVSAGAALKPSTSNARPSTILHHFNRELLTAVKSQGHTSVHKSFKIHLDTWLNCLMKCEMQA